MTDRAQNPTGAVLTAERATALRELLAHHPDVLVIDDDHGHAIVHQPLHTLAGATRSWASVRSVAKAYGPDLRLALFTADRVTADRVQGRFQLGPGWVSKLLQYAVVDLWERGTHDTAAVARSYGTRRDALIAALGERGVAARGAAASTCGCRWPTRPARWRGSRRRDGRSRPVPGSGWPRRPRCA